MPFLLVIMYMEEFVNYKVIFYVCCFYYLTAFYLILFTLTPSLFPGYWFLTFAFSLYLSFSHLWVHLDLLLEL